MSVGAAEPRAAARTRKARAAAGGVAPASDPAAERQREAEAAGLFRLAADPTRLAVLRGLRGGEQFVGQMCTGLNISQPALSHHLALLRHAGLVTPRRDGKSNFYALTRRGAILADVADQLASRGDIGR